MNTYELIGRIVVNSLFYILITLGVGSLLSWLITPWSDFQKFFKFLPWFCWIIGGFLQIWGKIYVKM